MKSKEEIIAKYNFICDPDVLETVEAMMEEYQQSQPSGMRWVREKPANDREFVLVTASLINGEWHYHGWEIIEVPDGYFALCELHGEEWGPYEDLSAEYYLVLSPVSESSPAGADEVKNSTGFVSVIQNGVANFYPAGAAEGASEGMADAFRADIKRLDELRRLHIEPYNLGEMGEISRIISRLANKLASLCSPGSGWVKQETISDGLGSEWLKKCPDCGKDEMVVVRPGKVQCNNCG